jgi:hypothetical protein
VAAVPHRQVEGPHRQAAAAVERRPAWEGAAHMQAWEATNRLAAAVAESMRAAPAIQPAGQRKGHMRCLNMIH